MSKFISSYFFSINKRVEANCEFSYSSAKAYMKASIQKGRGLSFSSINSALGYDRKKEKPAAEKKDDDDVQKQEQKPALTSKQLDKSINQNYAQRAILSLNDIDLTGYGARDALLKVIDHCNKLLEGVMK